MFQSTHPRGVRQEGCISYHAMRQFQSTHPRGVRHAIFGHISFTIRVSIHAPTRGATHSIASILSISLFQSTHPRGVRHELPRLLVRPKKFQSTHPRGVRLYHSFEFKHTIVSIHAPTRGATFRTCQLSHTSGFQSTHPRGVRPT